MQYTESENIKMDHNLDLSQIRCHIEYKTDDNEAVRQRDLVFTMACTVQRS